MGVVKRFFKKVFIYVCVFVGWCLIWIIFGIPFQLCGCYGR